MVSSSIKFLEYCSDFCSRGYFLRVTLTIIPMLVYFKIHDSFVSEYKILDDGDVKNCSTDNSFFCQEQSREQKFGKHLFCLSLSTRFSRNPSLYSPVFFIAFIDFAYRTPRLFVLGSRILSFFFISWYRHRILKRYLSRKHFAAKVGAVRFPAGRFESLSFFSPEKSFSVAPIY